MFRKLDRWFHRRLHNFMRFIFSLEVDITVRSPFYPVHVELYAVVFKSGSIKLDSYKVELGEDYEVRLDLIYKVIPWFHNLKIKYPDGWFEDIDRLLKERADNESGTD
jgi:hypothetical protein